MIERRPTGKRERYYFKTQKEAKKRAADRNNQIAAFGTQVALPETERAMAAECIKLLSGYEKTLYDATHFYLSYLDREASSISVAELCEPDRRCGPSKGVRLLSEREAIRVPYIRLVKHRVDGVRNKLPLRRLLLRSFR